MCCREGCNVVLEECWCFSNEEQMLEAKKLEFYCSTACWIMDQPEKFKESMAEFKEKCHGYYDWIDWSDKLQVMDAWEVWLSERFDGSEMAEMIGSDMECPI